MNFTLKKTKGKEIAKENDTSFNNVIISMIEHCLNEEKKEEKVNN